jgi:1-acyl-sn-glycerol-3-phosphate acyltransferase
MAHVLYHKFFYHVCHQITMIGPRLMRIRSWHDGMEHVPRTGAALLVCNHISHFDPSFLGTHFPRYIHYMADKPLVEIPIFGWMLRQGYVFSIDRTKNDRSALRTTLERLKQGNVVGIFPEQGIRHGAMSALGGAELPVGTASLWKMTDVPVIPMVVIGSDQLYDWKNLFRWRRRRVFVRVGPILPPDKSATREELRDRIVAAWQDIFASLQRDYHLRPEEMPQSAQQRWGQAPAPAQTGAAVKN